jgi:hypothetical protein
MKILLDECVDQRFRKELLDHEVITVQEAGWAGKKNGELLALAATKHQVFITVDRNLYFQQNLPKLNIAVLILVARSNRLADLKPLAVGYFRRASDNESGRYPHGSNPKKLKILLPLRFYHRIQSGINGSLALETSPALGAQIKGYSVLIHAINKLAWISPVSQHQLNIFKTQRFRTLGLEPFCRSFDLMHYAKKVSAQDFVDLLSRVASLQQGLRDLRQVGYRVDSIRQ